MTDMLAERQMSSPRKRNHEGELVNSIPLLSIEGKEVIQSDQSVDTFPRHGSEAPSTTSSLTELTSTGINSPKLIKKMSSIGDESESNKKRKLTFAEREVEKAVKKREREEREKEKAEAKARKDEEKKMKDEERRKKEEEKEHVKRIKELEKAEKKKVEDAKKQEKEERRKARDEAKEAERLKKERSQLRIASFFSRPTAASTPPLTPDELSSRGSSRRSSIASIDEPEPEAEVPSTVAKPPNPEYEKSFIPFFVHENTTMAPVNRCMIERGSKAFSDHGQDFRLGSEVSDVEPLSVRFGRKRRLLMHPFAVKEIIDITHSSTTETIDLSREGDPLSTIPYKFLSFREDVRPPYIGTYTKSIPSAVARKMSRKPTYKGRTDTNYDYDSEAEWEPPAEDDEELNDDEMSDDEEGDAEMDDFLDDEGDLGRRRMFDGDMDPVSSGLCWQGEGQDSNGYDMNVYRMDVLHDSTTFPIDPYASTQWSDEAKVVVTKTKTESNIKKEETENIMLPPRLPLASVSVPNTIPSMLSPFRKQDSSGSENTSSDSVSKGRSSDTNKTIKMVQPEYLSAFKQAVEGSDLTKAGLIEILKKQFPKCSKDAIKDTLSLVAIRVGKKEAEKRWQLID